MQLFTDANNHDLRLLDLRGLTPLNPDMVGGEVDLRAMLESHNDRCARAVARLRQLSEDRRRLGEFAAWEHKDSATLLAERARLRGANWDALVELRHVLEEREDITTQIEQRLRERYFTADQEHDQAVAAAERRLAKERRRLERTNPATAGSHFADLVAQEQTVADAAASVNDARAAFEAVAHARRGVVADSGAVKMRQREVFRALVS